MSYDKDKLAKMSGENMGGGTPKMILDKVRLHGGEGMFKKTLLTKPKNDDDRYDVEDIGTEIKVVFLKVRRYLAQETNDGVLLQTSEHNSTSDIVNLYRKDEPDTSGKASDLRELFKDLKTIQVIYALLLNTDGSKVVRFIVKGSSLGSQNKPEDSIPFYDYLTSFNRTGDNPEHTFEYATQIIPKPEKGPAGDYYAMHFQRGEKLTDEQMEKVSKEMEKIFAFTQTYDEYMKEKIGTPKVNPQVQNTTETPKDVNDGVDALVKEEIDTIKYPQEEDINPEDIPF